MRDRAIVCSSPCRSIRQTTELSSVRPPVGQLGFFLTTSSSFSVPRFPPFSETNDFTSCKRGLSIFLSISSFLCDQTWLNALLFVPSFCFSLARSRSDFGIYKCLAQNQFGYDYDEVYVGDREASAITGNGAGVTGRGGRGRGEDDGSSLDALVLSIAVRKKNNCLSLSYDIRKGTKELASVIGEVLLKAGPEVWGLTVMTLSLETTASHSTPSYSQSLWETKKIQFKSHLLLWDKGQLLLASSRKSNSRECGWRGTSFRNTEIEMSVDTEAERSVAARKEFSCLRKKKKVILCRKNWKIPRRIQRKQGKNICDMDG